MKASEKISKELKKEKKLRIIHIFFAVLLSFGTSLFVSFFIVGFLSKDFSLPLAYFCAGLFSCIFGVLLYLFPKNWLLTIALFVSTLGSLVLKTAWLLNGVIFSDLTRNLTDNQPFFQWLAYYEWIIYEHFHLLLLFTYIVFSVLFTLWVQTYIGKKRFVLFTSILFGISTVFAGLLPILSQRSFVYPFLQAGNAPISKYALQLHEKKLHTKLFVPHKNIYLNSLIKSLEMKPHHSQVNTFEKNCSSLKFFYRNALATRGAYPVIEIEQMKSECINISSQKLETRNDLNLSEFDESFFITHPNEFIQTEFFLKKDTTLIIISSNTDDQEMIINLAKDMISH